jgi:hypothetical protein
MMLSFDIEFLIEGFVVKPKAKSKTVKKPQKTDFLARKGRFKKAK